MATGYSLPTVDDIIRDPASPEGQRPNERWLSHRVIALAEEVQRLAARVASLEAGAR